MDETTNSVLFLSTVHSCLFSWTCPRGRPRPAVHYVWNVMAHAQKSDFVFRRNGRVHSYRRGRQFSRLLAAEVCASEVVMLDTPCSEIVWSVLATHSIRQFPLHFPSRASPCAITFHLDSTTGASCSSGSRLALERGVDPGWSVHSAFNFALAYECWGTRTQSAF